MESKIWNGDAIDFMETLENESVDLIVTDPPYGTDYKSNRQGIDRERSVSRQGDVYIREQYFSEIKNDKELPIDWLSSAFRVLKNGGAIYIFCHWTKFGELLVETEKAGLVAKNMLVMNKSNHGMGDLKGSYAPKHELVLFAAKGRHILNQTNGRRKDVLEVPVVFSGRVRLHPNEKPVSWYEIFISESSLEGDVVLDPFAGSGTAGVACKKLNRKYFLCELDEAFFEIAKNRVENE